MKSLLKIISSIGLVLSIVPPLLFFFGRLEMSSMKGWMGIGMALWLLSAPFWINKKQEDGRAKTEEN